MRLPKELTTVTKLSKYLAMVVFVSLPILGFIFGVQYQKMLEFSIRQKMESNLAILRSQTPTTTPTINLSETLAWKTYTNTRSANPYSFSYPEDWKISYSDYLNSVRLAFMNNIVGITFSDSNYPYSFPGENDFKSQELEIIVAGKEYAVKETIINNNKAYVDFSTDTPNKIYILFGTGYPAASDNMRSLDTYYKTRDTIIKILSTFRFSP